MEKNIKSIHLCNRILTQANKELERMRYLTIRNYILNIMLACILFFFIIIIRKTTLILLILPLTALVLPGLFSYNVKKDSMYVNVYNKLIIVPIIKEVFKNAKYFPKAGLRPTEYDMKMELYDKSAPSVDKKTKKHKDLYGFYPIIGEYSSIITSEDRIVTNQTNSLIFSEIKISGFSETKGIGPLYKNYAFSGIAGNFKSPIYFKEVIRISRDSFEFGKNIKMDSEEFERNFNIHTTTKFKVYTILTPDVMLKLINYTKKFNNTLEMVFWQDRVYFRFECDKFFDVNLNPNDIDINTLVEYYNLLVEIKSLTDEVGEILNSVNVVM